MEAWEFFRDEIDLEVAREAYLQTRKLNYENAYAEYESCIAALSRTQSNEARIGLRENAARALHALERARREYRETLLQTAFGERSERKDQQL